MVGNEDHGALLDRDGDPLRRRVRPLLPLLLPRLSRRLDQWAEWLVRTRWEGRSDEEVEKDLARLAGIRDRVLEDAEIRPGDRLVDVGAGTGLLTVGALERVGEDGEVIAVDISGDCIDELLREVRDPRLSLLLGDATVLPLLDASADVVTTRSVLIYVEDKAAAAREFFRVLGPGGRVSLYEPINRRNRRLVEMVDFGALAERVAAWEELGYADPADPMLNFDAGDLERAFGAAGFVELRATPGEMEDAWSGETILDVVGAPGRPKLREQLQQAFSVEELEGIISALEGKQVAVTYQYVYLAGKKPS